MACIKRNADCQCTHPTGHDGKHKCACGQEWATARTQVSVDEHALMMDLRATTQAEGDRIEEAMQAHEATCSILRGMFDMDHAMAHTVMHSFRRSCEENARATHTPIDEYMEGMSDVMKGLVMGSIAGALLHEAGKISFIHEEGDGE